MVLIDLTGKRFGRLEVLCRDDSRKGTFWICQCDCGEIKSVDGRNLKGKTKSCGCLHNEIRRKRHRKHSEDKLYSLWSSVKSRCFCKNYPGYQNYGGRGISLYNDWINDSDKFVDYVKSLDNCLKSTYSIDRIDVNGNYEPGNLRWADKATQSRNRRSTKFTELEVTEIREMYKTQTAQSIAEQFGVTRRLILSITSKQNWKNI